MDIKTNKQTPTKNQIHTLSLYKTNVFMKNHVECQKLYQNVFPVLGYLNILYKQMQLLWGKNSRNL